MPRELITTRAAAALLGVGTTSIKRWADDGTLAHVRTAGGHRRFRRGDVLQLLRDGAAPAARPVAAAPADVPLVSLDRAQLDALPYGVIRLDDRGLVLEYNAFEQRFAGLARGDVLGRDFFASVAPCTNNRLLRGRFLRGVAEGALDVRLDYTFTYKMSARVVGLHLLRDPATGSNWLLVHPG